MDFDDVRNLAELLQAGLDVLMRGPHPDDRHQTKSKRARIDPRAISFDDAGVFKALHALGDGRLGQSDRAAEFGQRHPRVGLKGFQDFDILAIDAAGTIQPQSPH